MRVAERSVYLGDGWRTGPMGIYVPPRPSKGERYRAPVAVDLFAGAGGFGVGLHQAGFHVAAAMDFDPSCAITYCVNLAEPGVRFHFDTNESRDGLERALEREYRSKAAIAHGFGAGTGWLSHWDCPDGAHGGSHEGIGFDGKHSEYLAEINRRPPSPDGCQHYFFGDIRNFTGQQILDALGLDQGEVDLVVGGPPCQGFSIAGRRNVHDPRNSLVFEFARLVVEIQPKSFVMENVPGMASMTTPSGDMVMDVLIDYFADGGMGTRDMLRSALAGHPEARSVRRGRTELAPVKDDDLADEPAMVLGL